MALSGLTLAQTSVENETQPAVATAEAAYHPFFHTKGLPEWSKLTPEQALIDAKVAVRLV